MKWQIIVAVLCSLLGVITAAALHQNEAKDVPEVRVERSFGSKSGAAFHDDLNSPDNQDMIDWSSLFNKNKRQMMGAVGSNGLGAGMAAPNLQDWTSTFGRNYRSFGNSGPPRIKQLGQGGGFSNDRLQNWQSFFDGSHAKRR